MRPAGRDVRQSCLVKASGTLQVSSSHLPPTSDTSHKSLSTAFIHSFAGSRADYTRQICVGPAESAQRRRQIPQTERTYDFFLSEGSRSNEVGPTPLPCANCANRSQTGKRGEIRIFFSCLSNPLQTQMVFNESCLCKDSAPPVPRASHRFASQN